MSYEASVDYEGYDQAEDIYLRKVAETWDGVQTSAGFDGHRRDIQFTFPIKERAEDFLGAIGLEGGTVRENTYPDD